MIRALRSLHQCNVEFFRTHGFDPHDNYRWRELSTLELLNLNGFEAQPSPGRHGSDFVARGVQHGEIKTRLTCSSPRFEWSRLQNPRALATFESTDCFVFSVFSRIQFDPQHTWVVRDPEAVIALKALVKSRIPPPTAARDTVGLSLKEILEFRHEVMEGAQQ